MFPGCSCSRELLAWFQPGEGSPRRSKDKQPREQEGQPQVRGDTAVSPNAGDICVRPQPPSSCTAELCSQMGTKQKNTLQAKPQLQSSGTGSSHFPGLEHEGRSGKLGPQVSDCLFGAPLSTSARRRLCSLCLPARLLLSASLNAPAVPAALPAPQHPDNSVFKTLIIIKPCYFIFSPSSCRIS